EVGDVVAGPLLAVPPHPLLLLAPRLAVEIGGAAVVHDPPVGRPRVPPAQVRAALTRRIGLLAGRAVLVGSGKHAAVDPRRAGGRPVVLEIADPRDVTAGLGAVVPVDLLQKLLGV